MLPDRAEQRADRLRQIGDARAAAPAHEGLRGEGLDVDLGGHGARHPTLGAPAEGRYRTPCPPSASASSAWSRPSAKTLASTSWPPSSNGLPPPPRSSAP